MKTQLNQEQKEATFEAEYEKMFGKRIVKDGIYCGEHAKNQTLEGYIAALEDFANQFCQDFTYSYWVQVWCTSDDGGGHYESYPAKGYNLRSHLTYHCVNAAFPNFNFKTLNRQADTFNNIPSGGKFNVTGLIMFLKKYYQEEKIFSLDKVYVCQASMLSKHNISKNYLEITSPNGNSVKVFEQGCKNIELYSKFYKMYEYARLYDKNIDYRKKIITIKIELTKIEMQEFLELSK